MSGRRTLGKLSRRRAEIRLTARDRYVCAAVHKARVMTTGDLALLVFPSVAIARRRLRRLHDGGFICGYVSAYSEENRWTLDKRGRALLGLTERSAPAKAPPTSEHRLMLVRLWVLLVGACHRETVRLERFSFEWELGGGGLPTERGYRPDAVLQLEAGGSLKSYLVEVDTGTEPLRHIAESKLPLVAQLRLARGSVGGLPAERVLFVAPSLRRLTSLLELAHAARVPALGRVLRPTEETLSLGSGWRAFPDREGALALPRRDAGRRRPVRHDRG